MKPPSGVSSEKEPDSKSARVKDRTTINNENTEHLLENNIETNNLRMPKKLSIQTTINNNLQRDEETYELEKFKKNAMIIFNHENFFVGDRRLGTALDVAALEDTFKEFRFHVTTRNDLMRHELFYELERFSKRNFNDYGCICVAILTHGQDGGFLKAFDTRYRERDAFSCFDALANPTLAGKPIIFLIQACRGSTAAARVPYGRDQNVKFDADTSENGCRPTESDMIIFHSSFFGRASVRVVEEGSWFIQTVCEQMKLHGFTHHLEELFLRVRQNVAALEYNGVKQMPVVTSTLLRKLYLTKIDESKIMAKCESDCRYKTYQPVDLNLGCEQAHTAHNGGSDDTYNGGSAPDDTYNGGYAPDDAYNGSSTPDDTCNGGSAPDDTYEETDGSNTEDGSVPDTYEEIDGYERTSQGLYLKIVQSSENGSNTENGTNPDTYEETDGSNTEDGSVPDTYAEIDGYERTSQGLYLKIVQSSENGSNTENGSNPDTYEYEEIDGYERVSQGLYRKIVQSSENGSNTENVSVPDTYEEIDGYERVSQGLYVKIV